MKTVRLILLLALAAGYPVIVAAQSNYEPFRVGTFAPTTSGDRPGLHGRFSDTARDLTIDAFSNIYVADDDIRKVAPNGAVTTLAGSPGGWGATDGTGPEAMFADPRGVTTDAAGNVYVADTSNHWIRKVTPDGVVTTLAGGSGDIHGSGSADGAGRDARFMEPTGLAVDGDGVIFVADTGNATIRRITPDGVVSTFAGVAGARGTADGHGATARFTSPSRLKFDLGGNLWVVDWDRLRKITPSGTVTTVTSSIGWYPIDITFHPSGGVYVTRENKLFRMTAEGGLEEIAGSYATTAYRSGPLNGRGAAARFTAIGSISVGSDGNIYALDGALVRRITPGGVVTTVAGAFSAHEGPTGPDDPGGVLQFSATGLSTDRAGNVYLAEREHGLIRKISPEGVVTTIAGVLGRGSFAYYDNGGPSDGPAANDGTSNVGTLSPASLSLASDGTIYFVEGLTTLRKVTTDGQVVTAAGNAKFWGTADGPADVARFNGLVSVAVDHSGNVYMADMFSYTIRKMTPDGVVSTFAGVAGQRGHVDGQGSSARFAFPKGVRVDGAGNVYVVDARYDILSNTVRKITPDGVVTTVAGLAGTYGNADGRGAAARFDDPSGLAVDDAGNIFVADRANSSIRKVTADGTVTTLAGSTGSNAGYLDGIGAEVKFDYPTAITVDGAGSLYIADRSRLRIASTTVTPQLLNIATRLGIAAGDERALIAGFIIAGSQQKNVVVRAIGPSLSASGVADPLPDTVLQLYDSDGDVVAANDNWKVNQQGGAPQEEQIRATMVAPAHDLESAVSVTLHPQRAYTAVVRGKNSASGTALVEVYDVSQPAAALLANISTRGFLANDKEVMIGGLILGGGTAGRKVLVRALGPSLAQAGITDALADTTLALHDSNGGVLASNDDWHDSDASTISATGIPPPHPSEAAILATLPSGAYTAVLKGTAGSSGVGLVEVYSLK
jgi:hypothetical protein